jgi:hypothetical protein
MRKVKTITTQDHMIHVVETDLVHDKRTCLNNDGSNLSLSSELSVFVVEGSENEFSYDGAGDWTLRGSVTGPAWSIAQPNVVLGSVATSNTEICIVFVPKESGALENTPGPDYVQEADVMNLDRESFVDVGGVIIDRQGDPDTFDDSDAPIDEKVPDDIVYE